MSLDASLSGPSFGPASGGAARQLVVLLHGWGADGDDLIGLAPHWAQALPDAAFVSPHAPYPCDMGFGRQWFSLGDMDPAGDLRAEAMLARLAAVAPLVDAFIDAQLDERGLDGGVLALMGFSQGAIAALHLGPRRARYPKAILGYSGRLLGGAALAAEAQGKPPVLLVHGEWDEVVPPASLPEAERELRAAGFDVTAEMRPRLGHGIDPKGLEMGGRFLAAHLLA